MHCKLFGLTHTHTKRCIRAQTHTQTNRTTTKGCVGVRLCVPGADPEIKKITRKLNKRLPTVQKTQR